MPLTRGRAESGGVGQGLLTQTVAFGIYPDPRPSYAPLRHAADRSLRWGCADGGYQQVEQSPPEVLGHAAHLMLKVNPLKRSRHFRVKSIVPVPVILMVVYPHAQWPRRESRGGGVDAS